MLNLMTFISARIWFNTGSILLTSRRHVLHISLVAWPWPPAHEDITAFQFTRTSSNYKENLFVILTLKADAKSYPKWKECVGCLEESTTNRNLIRPSHFWTSTWDSRHIWHRWPFTGKWFKTRSHIVPYKVGAIIQVSGRIVFMKVTGQTEPLEMMLHGWITF